MDEVVSILPLSASDLADGGLVQGVAIGDEDARFLVQVGSLDFLEGWHQFGFLLLLLGGRNVGRKGVGSGIVVSVGLLAVVGGRIVGHDPGRFAFAFPFFDIVASAGRRGGRSFPSIGIGRILLVGATRIAVIPMRPAVGQRRRGLLPLPLAHDALQVAPGGLGRLALRTAAASAGSGVRPGFVVVHHVILGDDSTLGGTATGAAVGMVVLFSGGRIGRAGRPRRRPRRAERRRRSLRRPLALPLVQRHALPQRCHVLGQAGRFALRVVVVVGVVGIGPVGGRRL
mmetsp:Transcript_5926/g.14182  ORF Transcript_5926/g.14182 Transcript_5926/m.14182 type:complete len:285 (+) Transcript_5926:2012-2866(+)